MGCMWTTREGTRDTGSALPAAPARQQARLQRADAVRSGVRIEQLTLGWMTVEAAVAIGAGVAAGSMLLVAFGLDSVIELITGGVLLWRLIAEARGGSIERVARAENRAAWVTGAGLLLLCLYIVAGAAYNLLAHSAPESAPAGIVLALAAVVGMPLLARRKRAIAAQIDSAALRGDAACSMTCAYMAATLLLGLLLTSVLHWWWADSLAALCFLPWLLREAREALEGARAGRGGCACGDPACED
jgi:divalent metal cation (Fe/Co/Zn/Cd) transporter